MVRIFGAAGHGKGLIDATSSFDVKSILRRDIILDKCFPECKEIYEYLTFRGDDRMLHAHLPTEDLDKKGSVKGDTPIKKGCMTGH